MENQNRKAVHINASNPFWFLTQGEYEEVNQVADDLSCSFESAYKELLSINAISVNPLEDDEPIY